MLKLKPFIKCLGGKTKLLPVLDQNLPPDFESKQWTYDEPFLGGGALLLHLMEKYPTKVIKQAYGNEFNEHLAYSWIHVISACPELVEMLERVSKIDYSENYDSTRIWFNEHCKVGSVDNTAYFMYLNHTCFNGLCRFNQKGKFNAPIGSYTNPKIFDKENLTNLNIALKDRVTIFNDDFQTHIETMLRQKQYGKNTLVYMDPPYIPLSITSNFTTYTPNGFGLYDHKRIRLVLDLLDSKGIKFMLSNSSTPLTYEIFKGYNIIEIDGKRSISAKVSGRKTVKEVLIKNY
jgi:DNA adenine methylase